MWWRWESNGFDKITAWWFGTFFMTFHSVGNNDPQWLSYFSRWLEPPTRSNCIWITLENQIEESKILRIEEYTHVDPKEWIHSKIQRLRKRNLPRFFDSYIISWGVPCLNPFVTNLIGEFTVASIQECGTNDGSKFPIFIQSHMQPMVLQYESQHLPHFYDPVL